MFSVKISICSADLENEESKLQKIFHIDSKESCHKLETIASRFTKLLKALCSELYSTIYGNTNYVYVNFNIVILPVGLIAIGYMDAFVKKMGDTCPESGRTYMPCCSSIGDIYSEYVAYHSDDHISSNQFYQLWNQNFKHVTFPKVRYVFT